MLQNTLCNVKEILKKNSTLNDKKIDVLLDNMELWRVDTIIYPSMIKSKLLISYKETYAVLDIIKDLGILTYNYQIYCSKCQKFFDHKLLSSLNQFPEGKYCDLSHKLSPIKDTVLVYRVIKDVRE